MEIHHEVNSIDMKFAKTRWNKGILPFHWHDKFEVIIPRDKPFGVLSEGVLYEVKPGDVVIIGGKVIHQFRVDEDDTNIYLGQFPYKILLNNGIVPKAVKPVIFAEEIAEDKVFEKQLRDIFDIMEKERIVMEGEQNPFLQSMFSAFYFLIMRRFSLPEESNTEKKEKKDFYRIVEFANEHFAEDITVQSIAQTLFMDRGKLSGLFSKYTGTTLKNYINTLRVKNAAKLIEQGKTVTEAALESGFQSVRTYNDVLKRGDVL